MKYKINEKCDGRGNKMYNEYEFNDKECRYEKYEEIWNKNRI